MSGKEASSVCVCEFIYRRLICIACVTASIKIHNEHKFNALERTAVRLFRQTSSNSTEEIISLRPVFLPSIYF